ncbi:MAG: hypothetical protein WAO19_07850 [Candidatus Kryptoniota bacterium]
MAENFASERKQIKYITFPKGREDGYLFLITPLQNFLTPFFSGRLSVMSVGSLCSKILFGFGYAGKVEDLRF